MLKSRNQRTRRAELEVPSLPFQTLIPTAEINEWLSDVEIDPG